MSTCLCALRITVAASLITLLAPAAVWANGNVVASIKPIHSLVAAIMKGVGTPALIIEGAGSPHTYSLKPSQAETIQKAELIFWVGHDLETFLEKPIETLGSGATVIALANSKGIRKLAVREGGAFQHHDQDTDDHHANKHGHGSHDPHLWLDPQNAKAMARAIRNALTQWDPENAARYNENTKVFEARLDKLVQVTATELAPVRDRPFVVFHDAFQYFENRFGLTGAGTLTISPEIMPGAERVAEIRDHLLKLGAACIFSEPQFTSKLVSVAVEGTGAKSGELDPLGSSLEIGPDLYFNLIRDLTASMRDCLSAGS